MLESIIIVNLAIYLIFGTVLLNRKYDLSKLYGAESKSLGIAFLLLMAFSVNLMPLVSAADGDGDGVEDANDECPDTVADDDWTVAENGCSYPSYLDNAWKCIAGGVMVQDLSDNEDEECSVSLSYDETYMTITTPGIANHDMEGGLAGGIDAQDYAWKVPLVATDDEDCNPEVSTDGCEMAPERGPVAVAVNGVPFYGPEEGPGGDAVGTHIGTFVEDRQDIQLGVCGAHAGPGGTYHYHYDGNCMHWHGEKSDDNYDISITDGMVFNPDDLTINVGDTVTWTNDDNMDHTATSTSGPVSFDSGNMASGATWSFTFTEAGTYDYKCSYHSSMTASITVVEPEIVWTDYDFSKVDSAIASPIVGFAFDGYPIYGAYGAVDGEVTLMRSNYVLKDGETGYNGIDDYIYSADNGGHLDACNGVFSSTAEFPEGIYHYHSTMPVEGDNPSTDNAFPYFINCYAGVAESSNFDGGGGPTTGGPPDADGDHVGDGWDLCSDTGDTSYPDGFPMYPRGCTREQFYSLGDDNQDLVKVAYSGSNPPAPPDGDGDGIPDPLDNCVNTENGNLVYSDGCDHIRYDSDWFTWIMNGTHGSIMAVTGQSLNWTHSIVSIYNESGAYEQPSFYNAAEYETDLVMNHSWLEDGQYLANITLYRMDTVLADSSWIFWVGYNDSDGDGFVDIIDIFPNNSSEWTDSDIDGVGDNSDRCPNTATSTPVANIDNEGCSDSQNLDTDQDGINDQDDLCLDEDASGYDANADGCIDDSDNDGVKDNLDICPFDATDGCPAALENQQTEGECIEGDVKNEDCNSCYCEIDPEGNESWVCTEMDCGGMKEETPGFGIFTAITSCLVIVLRRRN